MISLMSAMNTTITICFAMISYTTVNTRLCFICMWMCAKGRILSYITIKEALAQYIIYMDECATQLSWFYKPSGV